MKKFKKLLAAVPAVMALALVAIAPAVHAETAFITVYPSNSQTWVFNGDPSTATPYTFNEDAASIGEGSLYVQPIGANPSDKFIAANPSGAQIADFTSVSYDFKIAGDGVDADAQHFYLNLYTNLLGSSTYYDCRFDYVPATGSTTSFTTATVTSASTPVNVGDRAGDGFTCPATLGDMPLGSTVKFIAINVGDTSANDQGLAGYLDNVVMADTGNVVTYDFEDDPTVLSGKEACKNNGWMTSDVPVFKNQGDCVSHFVSKGKPSLVSFLLSLL